MDDELSTLEMPGNRSSLLGVFWPIDAGCDDWLEPLKRRPPRAGERRLLMQNRPPECYVDERTGDLGPYVRWLVALRVLLRRSRPGLPWKRIHADCAVGRRVTARELLAPLLPLDDPELLEMFDSAFCQDDSAWKFAGRYMHGRLFERIVERLNAVFPDRPPIDRGAFLGVRNLRDGEVLEPRTLVQFEHWLRHGVHPPNDDLGGLMCEELLRSPAHRDGGRGDQLDQVFRLLQSPTLAQPVVNLHAKNCWTGLRAFATAVLDQLVTLRGAGDPDAPLGLVYLRLSRSGAGGEAPTPASVVRTLRRAFSLPVEQAPEGDNRPFDLHADLLPIRRALSIYRTVIVVDGLAHSEGPMAELFDMLRNTHWPELLRVLMQPHAPTLAQRGGRYPSRLLVLSGEPVSQLRPWLAEPARRLAEVPRDVDARALLVDDAARTARLRAVALRLGARDSTEGLDRLFPLDDDQREALYWGREPHQIPTELDLALACLHSGKDLRAMWQLHQTDGRADLVALRRQQLSRWMQAVVRQPRGFADLLVFKLVACSVNGLRLSTLRRCLQCWLDLVGPWLAPAHAQQVRDFVAEGRLQSLAERYPQLVVLNRDEDVEAIGLRQRRFELQAFPDAEDTPQATEDDRPLLDVRLEGLRELVFAELIHVQPEGLGDAAVNPLQRPRGEWELMNLVLAEEALRQATTQLRNVAGPEIGTPALYRRLVQCVHHGLLSHAYDNRAADGIARPQPTLPGFTLPTEPFRRFRYLYAFVFRHCIENAPEWTLSRGFVRSEMRFVLAGMFANPRWGVELLGNLHRMTPSQRRLRSGRDLRLSAAFGRLLGAEPSAWILRENALQTDILEALARSAYDTGRHGFARRLAHFVQRQRGTPAPAAPAGAPALHAPAAPGGAGATLQAHLARLSASLDALRDLVADASTRTPPGLQHDPVDHAFEKLMIDSRLARAKYRSARAMCIRWLTRHGLDCSAFEGIGHQYPVLPPSGETGPTAKTVFETRVLQPLVERVLHAGASTRDRVALADVLSRLGESEAGLTDTTQDWQARLEAFLSAYALFWVADRVRSYASGVDDSIAWPRVSSQAMRIFIRLSLKIARILAEGAAPGTPRHRDGLAFYAQARRRMDVHASHLFRLPRERLAMLLLMASAARVWSELGGDERPAERRVADLHASLGYLGQAEALLFRLGFPDVLAYRFFFERAKTYRRLSEVEAAGRGETDRLLFERDLQALRTMSAADPFWRQVAGRIAPAGDGARAPAWFPAD